MLSINRHAILPLLLSTITESYAFTEDGDVLDSLSLSIKKGAAVGDRYLVTQLLLSRTPELIDE